MNEIRQDLDIFRILYMDIWTGVILFAGCLPAASCSCLPVYPEAWPQVQSEKMEGSMKHRYENR